MNDSFASDIPASFVALYLKPGAIKAQLSHTQLAQRYDWCEDMAQMLAEPTAQLSFAHGVDEATALDMCLQSLLANPSAQSEAESRWVICRLAELLQWPMPEWAALGQRQA